MNDLSHMFSEAGALLQGINGLKDFNVQLDLDTLDSIWTYSKYEWNDYVKVIVKNRSVKLSDSLDSFDGYLNISNFLNFN